MLMGDRRSFGLNTSERFFDSRISLKFFPRHFTNKGRRILAERSNLIGGVFVQIRQSPLAVERKESVREAVENHLDFLVGLPQGLFRLLALGNVAKVDGEPFVRWVNVPFEPPARRDCRPPLAMNRDPLGHRSAIVLADFWLSAIQS